MVEGLGLGLVGLLVGGGIGAVLGVRGLRRLTRLRQATRAAEAELEQIQVSLAERVANSEADRERLELQLRSLEEQISNTNSQLVAVTARLDSARNSYTKVDSDTKRLQALVSRQDQLQQSLTALNAACAQATSALSRTRATTGQEESRLNLLLGKLDLYSRIDEYIAVGHFTMPQYMYDASERYQVELERVRGEQRRMIAEGRAVDMPASEDIAETKAASAKVLSNQAKLMLRSFNIECDLLIEKVSPSSLSRTLQQIEKIAEGIDKLAASLHCGISAQYTELKYRECSIYYEYKLRKADEQEEQRALREQMREEARARTELERAEREAEHEEKRYQRALTEARHQLQAANEVQRTAFELRVRELEARLAEAVAAKERAKSMAEQTRRGHVYVISNVGSFGENVYKIGLTRRLDPMERVQELGDASVPFPFDVHAVILTDDAPRLETELHRRFSQRRVNAVNLRKEFFRVSLHEIQQTAEEVVGAELDFHTTIAAKDWFETRRLQGMPPPLPAA